jgi:hypothetical protein
VLRIINRLFVMLYYYRSFEWKMAALVHRESPAAGIDEAAVKTATAYHVTDDDVRTVTARARIPPTTAAYYNPQSWRHDEPPILPEDIEGMYHIVISHSYTCCLLCVYHSRHVVITEQQRLAREETLPLLKPLANSS